MMSAIGTLIRTHLPVSLALVIIMLLAVGLLIVKHQNATLREQIEICASQKQALAVSNTALLASLREQNASLKALDRESKRKAALAREAMKQAHTRTSHSRDKARSLREARPGGDECSQMKALLRLY